VGRPYQKTARVPFGRRAVRWWAGQDLNLRIAFASRIYSPVPLTTRPPTHGGDPLRYANPGLGSYRDGEGFARIAAEHAADADVP
jgi:hypothetical protein